MRFYSAPEVAAFLYICIHITGLTLREAFSGKQYSKFEFANRFYRKCESADRNDRSTLILMQVRQK